MCKMFSSDYTLINSCEHTILFPLHFQLHFSIALLTFQSLFYGLDNFCILKALTLQFYLCAQNVVDDMYKSGNKPRAWEMHLELVSCHVDNLFSACDCIVLAFAHLFPFGYCLYIWLWRDGRSSASLNCERYDNTKFKQIVFFTSDNIRCKLLWKIKYYSIPGQN
jgi:hypothetical protein